MSDKESSLPSQSICSIEYESQRLEVQTKGTGAFYELRLPKGDLCTLFITSYEVLPIINKEEITGLKMVFEKNNMETPTPDWVKRLWISPYNLTIIELSSIAIEVLSRSNVVGLQCAVST